MRCFRNRLLLVIAFALLATSCGREFDPYWRILDFRLLAVKSSLPELRPGQTAEIEALTYVPPGQDVTYEWSWCPFRTSTSDEYACPFTQEDLDAAAAQALGVDELPPGIGLDLDLGTEPTAQLPYPGTAELVLGFCKQIQQALADSGGAAVGIVPVNCSRGVDATIRLKVTAGDKEIIAGKRINIWTESFQSNANPDVTGIELRPANADAAQFLIDQGATWVVDPSTDKDDWWVELDNLQPPEVWADVPMEIRSVVDPDSIEIWQPPAPQGAEEEYLPPESEVIVFRWMTTAGSFDRTSPLYDEELNELDEASLSEFEIRQVREEENDYDADGLLDDDDACPYVPGEAINANGDCVLQVWSIIRDGRLGIDWVQNTLIVKGRRQ